MMLCEEGYVAGAATSTSTKLIHAGRRSLESCRFRLVREGFFERQRLQTLAKAP
jgi:glycerol-3-phosphate dehydrogenase